MDRRSFLTALFGGVAATAAGGIVVSGAAKAVELPAPTEKKLDEAPVEFSQHRRRRRRPRRRVCTIRRNRAGRRVRVCRWV